MSELTPAPRGYPIKLVRDDTAGIVNPTGEPGDLWYGPCEDAAPWLRQKLGEEVTEYLLDPDVPELTDVLAVVEGLAKTHGLTLDDLAEQMRQDARGRFLDPQMMWGYHQEFDGSEEGSEG